MTIREALRTAVEHLERGRVSNARLTAEVLLAHQLSVTREYLYAHDDRTVTGDEYQTLEDAVYERVSGVPLQYIAGQQEFYGRMFRVTSAVLIPRPETEHVIEGVLAIVSSRNHTSACRMIDIGTGSGCIAVTLALEIPGSIIFGSDISEDALRVARNNASNLGAPVGFVCMDVLDAVSGSFDFIVSNPPYVRPGDEHRLQREVREHEPRVALFSPGDELDIYRKIVSSSLVQLRLGGYLLMEIGIGMEERVTSLLGNGWEKLPTRLDLQGIPRVVVAQKK